MQPTGTAPRPNLIQRLRAALSRSPLTPSLRISERMPDLEQYRMPHRAVDMKDWEVAYNMARSVLNPDRSRLMDQYDSLLVDTHLASVMESRVLRVVRSKYRLVDAQGKPKPELTRLLEAPWFEDFLQYAAEADFRGHTLIELGQLVRPGQLKNITRIDPRNVLPYEGLVIRRRGEVSGYDFRALPLSAYLIEVGRPEDLGILSQVAPVCIVKKYAVGSWSDYVEKFGIPPRWVTSDTTDKVRVRQLEEMMQNMVSSAYAVIQGTEKIEVMQTPTTDAHKVFDELIARMNSEVSKRVLGQDGTSDNKDASGTYGSLKVLQGVAEDRHQADKARVRHVINNDLLPRLVNLGYPFGGLRFEWDEFRDLSSTELVDAVQKLGQVFEIDPQYVSERTGIKIIGIKRAPGEVSDNPGAGRQGGKKKQNQKKTDEPDEDEDGGATASWPCVNPYTCRVCGGHRDPVALGDLSEQAVQALLDAAAKGEDWSNPYFTEVGMRYREGLLNTWVSGLKDLDYNAPDHAAAAAMEINLFRFSAAKTTAALLDLNGILKESNGYADFKRRVDESGMLDDYNRRWMQTEYQHAVQVGIQSSRYYQHVRDIEAFPYWEYMTQGDAQVRPAHAALDGKVFEAADPIWDRIYPPNGWGCRCTVMTVAFAPDKVYTEDEGMAMMRGADAADYKRMDEGGWLVNRSKSTVVFDLNKAYQDELRGKDKSNFTFGVNKSYASDRMDFESIKQRGLASRPVNAKSNADALTWFDANSQDTGASRVMVVTDHMGRKVHMGREDFERHLQGKHRTDRFETADLIPSVMAEPDEVWITESQRGVKGLSYVKFYDEGIMRVNAVPDEEGFRITTWTGNWADSERRGLLIKPHDLLK